MMSKGALEQGGKKCSVCRFYRFGEALYQVLRMYNVGGKMLSGIKSMLCL